MFLLACKTFGDNKKGFTFDQTKICQHITFVFRVSDMFLSRPKALIVAAIKVFFFLRIKPVTRFRGETELPCKFGLLTFNISSMLIISVKNGRKQTTIWNCTQVTIKATSFKASKRKDFSFKIKAKCRRPKVCQARLS